MKLEYVDPAALTPYEQNPRRNDEAVEAVAQSIRAFGFNCPIVIGPDNRICAGHTRWKAARKLGLAQVPVVRVDELTGDRFRAFNIADNKTAENAEWDLPGLAGILEELREEDVDLGDLGFSDVELRRLLDAEREAEDGIPEVEGEPVTKPGDLYLLGGHRLLCGDSRDRAALDLLVQGIPVDHVFAGAPCFNQKDYARWDDYDFYQNDMKRVIANATGALRPGGVLVWHAGNDSANHHDVTSHHSVLLEAAGMVYLDTIIWRKSGANFAVPRNAHITRTRHYYPAFGWEALLVFLKPGGSMPKMTREAADYMKAHPINVWDIAAVWNPAEQYGHSGPCPVELPYRCLLAYTQPAARVFDPFAGSGTSLVACEKSSRLALAMERIPLYCERIVKRWQTLTGGTAERMAAELRDSPGAAAVAEQAADSSGHE